MEKEGETGREGGGDGERGREKGKRGGRELSFSLSLERERERRSPLPLIHSSLPRDLYPLLQAAARLVNAFFNLQLGFPPGFSILS